ncbi:spore germination protein [Tenuibacillus multivorans]|uniref:Spore germination protein n=2 Tax=Tenuibacillus multivorans TaxID=237069 RepID=A0A1H0EV88_9BACI|nr:spore germination protein [Tenuibacillus multivorans]
MSLTLLAGCLEQNIIEDLGIVTVYGVDQGEDVGSIKGTTVIFQFNPDITDASQIISSQGQTFREMKKNANKKSAYKIVSGQLRSILFGPEVAKDGIFPYLDPLDRDAALSDLIFVAIANEPAAEVLSAQNYEQAPNVGTYIQELLGAAVRSERIVSSTLHEFIRNYFIVGQEPLVPILSKKNNKVAIDSIAIMKSDQQVGTLSLDEIFYVRLFLKDFKAAEFQLELPIEVFKDYLEDYEVINRDELYVVMDKIYSNTKIKLVDPDALKFKVTVDMAGRIVELTERLNLQNKDVVKLMEENIQKSIKENIQNVINKTQELQADVYGFGKIYNSNIKDETLSHEKWRDMYPNIDVDVSVNMKIRSYGTVE